MDSMMLWSRLLRLENLVLEQAREIDRLKLSLVSVEDYDANNHVDHNQQTIFQHDNTNNQDLAICPQHKNQQQAESMLLGNDFVLHQDKDKLASLRNLKSAIHPISAIPPVVARPHTTYLGLSSSNYQNNISALDHYANTARGPVSGQINWPPTKYSGFKIGDVSALDDDFGQDESRPKERTRRRSTLQELLTCFSPCFGF